MNGQDDKLGVHEESQDADPIPDAFPGQDPKVDRKWEKAKEDRWAVSLPPVNGSLLIRAVGRGRAAFRS